MFAAGKVIPLEEGWKPRTLVRGARPSGRAKRTSDGDGL